MKVIYWIFLALLLFSCRKTEFQKLGIDRWELTDYSLDYFANESGQTNQFDVHPEALTSCEFIFDHDARRLEINYTIATELEGDNTSFLRHLHNIALEIPGSAKTTTFVYQEDLGSTDRIKIGSYLFEYFYTDKKVLHLTREGVETMEGDSYRLIESYKFVRKE